MLMMTGLKEGTGGEGLAPRADVRVLKRVVRSVLPARAHGALRRAIHSWQLNRAPVMAVDVGPLPRAAEVSLADMFLGDGLGDGMSDGLGDGMSDGLGDGGGDGMDDGWGDGWGEAKALVDEVAGGVMGSHAIGPASRRAIYQLVRGWQPGSLLEIGTNHGASTLCAAMAMREYRDAGRPPRLVTVDLFDVNNPAAAEAKRYRISTPPREMLARLDCDGMVEFAIARSTDYLRGREGEFDFIFMDHSPAADIAYQDIALAIGALRQGGQLLIHPYYQDRKPLRKGESLYYGFYLAVGRLRQEGAPLVALPLDTLPWSAKPGGADLTNLALLARE